MAKLPTLFLTFFALIPLIFGQCTIENAEPYLRRSIYDFSTEFVSRIAQETDNHFITSALSPWTLIATMSLGATDETLEEIVKVLRLHPHRCFNKKFFEIIKKINTPDNAAILERSSTLFADDRLPLNEMFKNRVKKTEVSDIQTLPFDNSESVAATINNYVKEATRGNIDEIVSAADLDGVYLILIDALYFKGTWLTKFAPEDTEVSTFYDEKRNQIGNVNLMFSQLSANLTSVSTIEAKVLELPYGSSNRFSMLIFLPDDEVPLIRVIDNLKKISIRSIFTSFRGVQTVLVQLPRFKISSDMDNLKELLIDMGLRTMFDTSAAKFTDISDYSLYVSNFIQKANVEVTEEGTEASAVSGAFFGFRSARPEISEFTANKPFLFMIVDKETEVALFTGAYSKPTIY